MAELRDDIARYDASDPRSRKAARERKEALWRFAEIETELKARGGERSLTRLREKTIERTAAREAGMEWAKIARQKLAEAELDVQRGAEPWVLAKAKAEAKNIPADLLERKRQEVAARG
jgi:hypothetical protein